MSKTDTNTVLYQGQCIRYFTSCGDVEYQRTDYVIRDNTGCITDDPSSIEIEIEDEVDFLFSQEFLQSEALAAIKDFKKEIKKRAASSLPETLTWDPRQGVREHDWSVEIYFEAKAYVNELDVHCENSNAINFVFLSITNPISKKAILEQLNQVQNEIKCGGLVLERWQTPDVGVAIRSVEDWFEISPW